MTATAAMIHGKRSLNVRLLWSAVIVILGYAAAGFGVDCIGTASDRGLPDAGRMIPPTGWRDRETRAKQRGPDNRSTRRMQMNGAVPSRI